MVTVAEGDRFWVLGTRHALTLSPETQHLKPNTRIEVAHALERIPAE
jgi:hypothetical protein